MAVSPGVPDVIYMPADQGFVLPSEVSGIGSDNLFNRASANSFYNNFNDASVNYSADQTQEGQRLNDLIAAYRYLQDPPNQIALDQENYAGFSQYMLQKLQADVTEQNNLVQYGTAQSAYTTANYQLNGANAALGQLQRASNQGADTSSWGNIEQFKDQIAAYIAQQAGGQQNLNQAGINLQNIILNPDTSRNPPFTNGQLANIFSSYIVPQFQTAVNTANSAMTTAGGLAINGVVVNSPDYNQEQNAVTQYYQGNDATGGGINDPNSAVYQAIQPAIETGANSIYNQVYNIKNDINTQAAQTGVMNSGERQAALSNTQGAGLKAAQAVTQSAMNQAKAAEAAQAQSIQGQKATQTTLQKDLIGGGLQNLFSTATGDEVNAYNNQTVAQNTQAMANNEQAINTAQNQTNLSNQIFGEAGTGVGQLAGNALTSGVLI